MTKTVREPARDTPVMGEYDVVVLGGGPAGIAAASSAAKTGASTLLVERYGFLGGMGTAAGVTNFCGLHGNVHGEIRQIVHGFADELLDRMRSLGGLNEPHVLFGGKIAGVTRNLDYIAGLGCTAIWLSPIFENNPKAYHGYNINNYLSVDPRFGTEQDLIDLVEAAHNFTKAGQPYPMRVILDVVINHSGADLPELKLTVRVKSDKKEIYSFPFTLPSIGPFESKDFSVPMKTDREHVKCETCGEFLDEFIYALVELHPHTRPKV